MSRRRVGDNTGGWGERGANGPTPHFHKCAYGESRYWDAGGWQVGVGVSVLTDRRPEARIIKGLLKIDAWNTMKIAFRDLKVIRWLGY